LSPWWLRPTAEGLNEQPNKPEEASPSESTSSESASEESAPAPTTPAAPEPSPAPAWSAAPVWRPEPEPAAADSGDEKRDENEPGRTSWAPLEDAVAPEEISEAVDEALVELQTGEAEPHDEEPDEEERPEGRRKRPRRSRRRKPGARAAAAPESSEPGDEGDEEEDETPHEEPAAEEIPHPLRRPTVLRRPASAPVALASAAPLQRAFRSDTYVVPGDVEPYAREIVISIPERQRSSSDERKIAMFCDFENIALGVRDSEISKFDISIVLERLLEKGKIIVKKAYADWERYSEYKRPFHEAAIELIDIPQKYYSGKNSADIKMVVDAMDLSYSKEHLDTFVIVSGDSDFSPLVSKLKENNKYVIGIGVKNSSSSLLIDNCDEFIYYEDVWRDNQKGPKLDGLNKKTAEAFSLMIESIQALVRENKDVLWGSMIKQTMQRKRPSFNEGYYGYSSFSELLEDAERKQILKLKKDQRSGTYIVTGFAKNEAAARR
jgi:uncharacterized protein (TIGR00288 family)